jgi:hypothetical protein
VEVTGEPAAEPQRARAQDRGAVRKRRRRLRRRPIWKKTTWLEAAQEAQHIQQPFVVILILWLFVLFVSFGLFAPRNGLVMAASGKGSHGLLTPPATRKIAEYHLDRY